MTKLTVCDNCQKELGTAGVLRLTWSGWIRELSHLAAPEQHFCSLRCLSYWAGQDAKVMGPVTPPPDIHLRRP